MLSNTMKMMMAGGKIAALTALMGTTALAHDATRIETEDGNTAIVPGAAADAESSVGAVTESPYPLVVQVENDQVVAETLIAQGFTDVRILREGPMMTVTAQRDGQPIELVYSVANGSLVSVNGEELRREPEGASAGDSRNVPAASAGAATDSDADGMDGDDDASNDGMGEDSSTDDDTTGDGMTGDGMTDGMTGDGMTDGNSDDGMSGDDGSDAGADSSTDGADTGAEGSSDGASAGGDAAGGNSSGGDSSGGDSGGGDSDGGDSDGGDGTNG